MLTSNVGGAHGTVLKSIEPAMISYKCQRSILKKATTNFSGQVIDTECKAPFLSGFASPGIVQVVAANLDVFWVCRNILREKVSNALFHI